MPDAGQPPAHPSQTPGTPGTPTQRDKIIAQMLTTARELQAHGLSVHAIPIGSDINDCRGAVTALSVTNPAAPSQGHILIKRDHHTLAVTATWEHSLPIRDATSIEYLTTTITRMLSNPS